MSSLFQKTTKGLLFIICFFLAVVFSSLAFPDFERVGWYKQITLTIVTPPQKAITGLAYIAHNIWHHYIAISNAATENESLQILLQEATRRLTETQEVELENARLRALLEMAEPLKLKGIGARVIASDPREEFKTVKIDKGFDDGIRKNMAVIAPSGLVGKIGQVSSHYSSVLLISDPNSAVDVLVQRSRARAIMAGYSHGAELRPFYSLSRLEYLQRTSEVSDGDTVVTSGLDRLYPAGIPIGTIANLKRSDIFQKADVVPFADLGSLENVMVLK